MNALSVRARIFRAFLLVIIVPGLLSGILNYCFLQHNVISRAQQQVAGNLKVAHAIYNSELEVLRHGFEIVDGSSNLVQLKRNLNLDYIKEVDSSRFDSVYSPIVKRAARGKICGGTRIIDSAELAALGEAVLYKARIPLAQSADTLNRALSIEYASPVFDSSGAVTGVIYGGKITNRYFELIDKITDIVFDKEPAGSSPQGTITIFLDDIRIATNVRIPSGERAIGTRVSPEVNAVVLKQKKTWVGRAKVVSDWRLTAYEPLYDINGTVVGMIYAGILEKPYNNLLTSTLITLLIIMGAGSMLAILISILLSGAIANPLTTLVHASGAISSGDLTHKVSVGKAPQEILDLAASFNYMAAQLLARETSLVTANTELAALNKRYLDMVGMVSHELKGILSSTMLNAYSVKDGYLGPISEKQLRAMTSVARNLEYFNETIKRFLDLSRVERGELTLVRTDILLRDEIVDEVIRVFKPLADEKGMNLDNQIPSLAAVNADRSLITMVMNNLVGNAIKYGGNGGTVRISARREGKTAYIHIYNDGRPLTSDQIAMLFNRFTRLNTPETRTSRGAGLGLFLTREIIEKHGGTIRCESQDNGNEFIIRIPVAPESATAPDATTTGEQI